MPGDELIEEINTAYGRLGTAMEDMVRADRELADHVRQVRLDNAEDILEARNERPANIYIEGLLDTDEHRYLEAGKARAELALQHARLEVDRLQLLVRLLGTRAGEAKHG